MKKFVLAVALVLALALPVSAENPIRVFVNGAQLSTEAVMINDRVYVPLRAVSESLGGSVVWDERTNSVHATTLSGEAEYNARLQRWKNRESGSIAPDLTHTSVNDKE
jgi:hypothetical protein